MREDEREQRQRDEHAAADDESGSPGTDLGSGARRV
jgi:hypothetical protein